MACQNQIQTEQSQVSVPSEIVVDILLKLPVESLLRCRVVCKLWHSLISDPYFINSKYLSTTSSSISNIKLISSNPLIWENKITICKLSDALYDKSVSNKELTVDIPLELSSNSFVKIAASCHGLVCFYDKLRYKYMFIWNPTTRVYDTIYLGFRFDTYGFGYDESTDDYKFFASSYWLDNPRTRIYSLKTGIWNKIGNFPHCKPAVADGKYSNGALHWVGDRWMIVSFHFTTEKYGQVLQPEYDDRDKFDMSLGALREELCTLCYFYGSRSDIWVMKVYGVKESWTKLFSIPYMPDRRIILKRMPLFISDDGKIFFVYCRSLFVYDSENGSSSKIKNFKYLHRKAFTFVESLVSPMPTPYTPCMS